MLVPKYYKIQKSNSPNYKYSIIIPSWNNLEYLKLCLKSIKNNSHFNHQIIIIINEGIDGTLDWIANQPDIDYVHYTANMGICIGINSGRSLVKTNYIVYINDDMYVCPEWDKYIEEEISQIGHNFFYLSSTLIEPLNTNNKCVIVKNYGTNISSFNESMLLNEYKSLEKDDWYGSTWPPSIVHVDIWDMVGGLSIEFSPGFSSDPDFSRKLWELGIRYFKGISNSRVYHFVSKTTKRYQGIYRGKDQFTRKWGITTNFFTSNYLKKGRKFVHELPGYNENTIDKIVNSTKNIIAIFKKRKTFIFL